MGMRCVQVRPRMNWRIVMAHDLVAAGIAAITACHGGHDAVPSANSMCLLYTHVHMHSWQCCEQLL